ncbi:MAG: 1-phosphofructokinase family hexose kinase, partial [Armatimonadota bacterium]
AYVSKLLPNDTNRVTKVEEDAGGKGINCSRMLKELGGQTKAVAFLGGDSGEYIKLVLTKSEIPFISIETQAPTRTTVAVEELASVPPTTFNEPGGPIHHKELVDLLEVVKDVSRESSYVLFGGSVPLGLNHDIYKVLIQIAENSGAKAVLDADGEALVEGIKSKPFMIKPNWQEAERLLNTSFESKSDVVRGAFEIAKMGIELVIISLGKQGCVACYEDFVYDVSSPMVKPQSTIGSGDSLIAGVLYGLENGMNIEDCLKLGSACGAATAMTNGTEIGNKKDVDKLINQVKISKIAEL